VFTDYPALAQSSELLRRMASPLAVAEAAKLLARSGKTLDERSLDLAAERFMLYVPPRAPPGGYGLIVFTPPWNDAHLPPGWAGVLDREGVIFVSAVNSGNDANTVGRREPLALIAEANVARLYAVDPQRVWTAGFSGGAHVALRLAMGYPDVFDGALLNAGADPIGDAGAPLPPRDLFARFRAASRLVYVTGDKDTARQAMDTDSLGSMRQWCVAGVEVDSMPGAGHQVADAAALARALTLLQSPGRPDARRLDACRSQRERDLAKALDDVRALIAAGRRDEAMKRLIALDARFGGLAAPQSVRLAGD
jgi:dienelactone hydrolase